jgi:hypothetical protein
MKKKKKKKEKKRKRRTTTSRRMRGKRISRRRKDVSPFLCSRCAYRFITVYYYTEICTNKI